MSIPESRPAGLNPDRRRWQYSLAELLALTTIISIGLSLLKWLGIKFDMDVVLDLVPLVAIGGLYVGFAAWSFTDARKRGYPGIVLVVLVTLLGPAAVIVWLFVRPKAKIIMQRPADYTNPDEAFAAALQLDMQGDWDAAIALYGEVARRWPEHEHYAQGCIREVEEKRSPRKDSETC